MSEGRGGRIGLALFVIVAVLVVVLSLRAAPGQPFDAESTSPGGYGALAELVRGRGAETMQRTAVSVAQQGLGLGDVIVVPVPGFASRDELDEFSAAADRGAVVVYGSAPPPDVAPTPEVLGPLSDDPVSAPFVPIDDQVLAETPAEPAAPGRCDVAALGGLGPIDVAFTQRFDVEGRASCFGDGAQAQVTRRSVGAGAEVTLGGPEMFANARVWPDKESGGAPLDNGALALRLLGPTPDGATDGVRVTFVRAEPSPGAVSDGGNGTSNPLRLLPTGVQLALGVAVLAFVLYAWSRARRLGRPVREQVPVAVAGSELTAAVGDLLRRKGSPDRAAGVIRSEASRELGVAAALGPAADPAALCSWVAARTGRSVDEVADTLYRSPVSTSDDLVRLIRSIDQLHEEVRHDRLPR